MKKYLKMLAVIVLLFNVFALIVNISEVKATAWSPTKAIEDADDEWKSDGITTDNTIGDTVKSVMSTAINVIRVVGTGIAVIMISYVAIKYMTAAPQEKADFKKSATAYVVGAVVLFASTNILKVIADFASTIK